MHPTGFSSLALIDTVSHFSFLNCSNYSEHDMTESGVRGGALHLFLKKAYAGETPLRG